MPKRPDVVSASLERPESIGGPMTAILRQTEGTSPPPADARDYLAGLLAAPDFRASPRRRALLNYIVEQTLAGRSHRLKAFDLAVAVLGRNERFDPQNDPIVRIEVGRLRRDLDQYYAEAGRLDPIRISIPKGHYVPAFEARGSVLDPAPIASAAAVGREPGRRWLNWRSALLAVLCPLFLLGAVWRFGPWGAGEAAQQAGPAVLVLPLTSLTGDDSGQLLASGLTGMLVADLMRFEGMQVFAGQSEAQAQGALPAAAAGLPAYLVGGSVERAADRVRVTARLSDRGSGLVLWSESYDRPLGTKAIFDVEAEITAAITGELAQVYGVINAAAASQLTHNRPATLFAYDCVQRAFAYRRTFAKELYPPVRACLEDAVRVDPNYAAAWAMLAFAHLDAARFRLVEPDAQTGELRAGLEAARHAIELAPGSVTAQQSLAALQFGSGAYEEAEQAQRRAIALNPRNPESLAQLGWRLMARGRWEEGGHLLRQAIDNSVVVPAWYHETLALALYLGGDFQRARDEATLGSGNCCSGYATLALTEAAVGNMQAAHQALEHAEALRR